MPCWWHSPPLDCFWEKSSWPGGQALSRACSPSWAVLVSSASVTPPAMGRPGRARPLPRPSPSEKLLLAWNLPHSFRVSLLTSSVGCPFGAPLSCVSWRESVSPRQGASGLRAGWAGCAASGCSVCIMAGWLWLRPIGQQSGLWKNGRHTSEMGRTEHQGPQRAEHALAGTSRASCAQRKPPPAPSPSRSPAGPCWTPARLSRSVPFWSVPLPPLPPTWGAGMVQQWDRIMN